MPDPDSVLVNIALFGASPAITLVLEAARAAAKHIAPVLLVAEPGLEVTLLATQIHQWSGRTGRLQRVHAAELVVPNVDTPAASSPLAGLIALPLLLETIRAAKGGTLLIEDIEVLPESGQAIVESLLNQLPLNATASDVRVIASTSSDLGHLVHLGRFRPVLLDRLLYAPIQVPALRARQQDVLILSERILGSHRLLQGRPGLRLNDRARQVLQAHKWPGNIVELERVLVRAAFESTDGTIRGSHLTRAIAEPGLVFRSLNAGTPREAHDRASAEADKIADQKKTIDALLDGLVSLRDQVVMRELARVETLTLKEVGAVLALDGAATRRHMARMVRAGQVVQGGNAHLPTWSLLSKAEPGHAAGAGGG